MRTAFVCAAIVGVLLAAPTPGARAAGDDPRLGKLVQLPSQSTVIYNEYGLHSIFALTWRRPLLVLSWRADDKVSVEQVVPSGLELQERYGDDLVVIFAERSGLSFVDMLRFAAGRHWLCGAALWTSEALPGADAGNTPSFVLTSPSGVVVIAGDPVADRAELLAGLPIVVELRHQGGKGLPEEAHEAWRALASGQFASALGLADTAKKRRQRGGPGDAAAADILDKQARAVSDDISTQLGVVSEMNEGGALAESLPRYGFLSQHLKDLPKDDPLRQRAEPPDAGCTETIVELKASEKLLELRNQLCKKGPSEALARAFKKLSATHKGTQAAARALFLADVAAPP